jgi:hypothetical protein
MDKLELLRVALRELGSVSAQHLSSFIARTHGVVIAPEDIPLVRACLRQKASVAGVRQAARAAAEGVKLRALAE